MSWAAERRAIYLTGILVFFAVVIGGPLAYKILTIAPTCHDGIQNHGETAIDRGGPCLLLNEADLLPYSVIWARAFAVRDGSYTAVAYIENPNKEAGVEEADYTFRLYDDQQIILAQRQGKTYIMPGGVTPIFETHLDTGQRTVVHTTFEFTNKPFVWEKMHPATDQVSVSSMLMSNTDSVPLLKAVVTNNSAIDSPDLSFVAVVFDTVGNAMNASATQVPAISGYAHKDISFSWPVPFALVVGSTDILPLAEPIIDAVAER